MTTFTINEDSITITGDDCSVNVSFADLGRINGLVARDVRNREPEKAA